MIIKQPKYRRPLNSNQLQLLYVLYKFRFATTDLVAAKLKKDRSSIYESLHVLAQQGYVHKFYDKTYRLQGKAAVYTLASHGVRYLRTNTKLDQTTLRNFYKNKRMGIENEEYVSKCLLIFKIATIIQAQTGDQFSILTKYELNRELFIYPLPELYLQSRAKPRTPGYILDIFFSGTMTWLLKKRLAQHQDFAESSPYLYPDILLVTGNISTEKRLFKQAEHLTQAFKLYITQQELLLSNNDRKIWINVDTSDEDELIRATLSD